MTHRSRRPGVSSLEIQLSILLLGIGLAGICPLVMMQLKLLRRIESTAIGSANYQVVRGQRFVNGAAYVTEGAVAAPPTTILQPRSDHWQRRLGTAAPFRDAVKVQASASLPTESTIDDDTATFAGTWATQTLSDANGGTCRVLDMGSPTSTATWSIGSITAGTYRVLISWPSSIPIPSDTSFIITDASSGQVVVTASQLTSFDGATWYDLGNYSLGSSFTLTLSGSNSGQVAADGVRIGRRNTVSLQSDTSSSSSSSTSVSRRAKVVKRS